MAHNPPRPGGMSPEEAQRVAGEIAKPSRKPWADISELAGHIEARAKQGKRVVLSPETALIVARVLREATRRA